MYRKGTIEDCKEVYNLISELENKQLPFEKFSEIYQKQLKDSRYYCLVCECDNTIIGVLNLRFEEQLHHVDNIAEILEFSISAAYRKKGIGKEMLAAACQIAKEFGCTQIEAASNQLRTEAHRFYEREDMHNFHFKFSKSLIGANTPENIIGR